MCWAAPRRGWPEAPTGCVLHVRAPCPLPAPDPSAVLVGAPGCPCSTRPCRAAAPRTPGPGSSRRPRALAAALPSASFLVPAASPAHRGPCVRSPPCPLVSPGGPALPVLLGAGRPCEHPRSVLGVPGSPREAPGSPRALFGTLLGGPEQPLVPAELPPLLWPGRLVLCPVRGRLAAVGCRRGPLATLVPPDAAPCGPLGSLLTHTCSSALCGPGLSPLLSVLRPAPSLPGAPRAPGAPPCATAGASRGSGLGGGGSGRSFPPLRTPVLRRLTSCLEGSAWFWHKAKSSCSLFSGRLSHERAVGPLPHAAPGLEEAVLEHFLRMPG